MTPAIDITPTVARPESMPPSTEAASLRRIATELINTAVLTVVIASIANARTQGRTVLCPLLSPGQIPPAPSDELVELANNLADSPGKVDGLALKTACQEIGGAREESGALLGTTLERASWARLSECWCRVSARLIPALDTLDSHFAAVGAKAPPYRAPALRRLLHATAAGQSPSIGRRGEIVVPGWIERRSAPRFTLLQPVWIVRNGNRQRAATVDISASGIGIVGLAHPTLGESISIELSPSLIVDGLIVWARDDRCGLRITNPPRGLIEV